METALECVKRWKARTQRVLIDLSATSRLNSRVIEAFIPKDDLWEGVIVVSLTLERARRRLRASEK